MAEEMLYDSKAMWRFAGIELGDGRIPDGPKGPWRQWRRVSPQDTILNFRHLLERHGLTEAIFAEVNAYLAEKGMTLRSGRLVDATIIDAPSSTKNKARARDPEMSSTKKGNDWYFGSEEDEKSIRGIDLPTNAHVGVDADSGVTPEACLWHDTHSRDTTTARVHDSRVWDDLLHGEETSIWADKGYVSAGREAAFGQGGKVWGVRRYNRSPGSIVSRLNCARRPRAASSIPSTKTSTTSSPRSSIRSAW